MNNLKVETWAPLKNTKQYIYNQCWLAMKESTGHILITGNTGLEKTLANWFSSEIRSFYYFQRNKITQEDILNILNIKHSIIFIDDMRLISPEKTDIKILEQLSNSDGNQFIITSEHPPCGQTASMFQTEIFLSCNETERKTVILIKGEII